MTAQGHVGEAAHAWARARLTRGTSVGEIWEITSAYPEARLSVGSDPQCGWQVQAPGVALLHCEFFWDGQALWIADSQRAGGVFLDGERVYDWVQVHGPAEIRFGQAAMDVETSAPENERMLSSPSDARPITITDAVAPPSRGHDLDSAKTKLVPARGRPDTERTRLSPAPEPPKDTAGFTLRPRLGGAPKRDAPAEATKMVTMPEPAPAAAPAEPAPPPPAPAEPELGAPRPPSASTGPFVAPPTDPRVKANRKSALAIVWDKLKPEKRELKPGQKTEIPIRTWILLAITVLAAVGLMFWEDEPETSPAQPPAIAIDPANLQPATPPHPEPPPPTPPPVEPAAVDQAPPGAEGPSLERRAIDLYIAGSYPQSLLLFRQLAAQAPSDAAYAQMVRILERRIAERCHDGVGPQGEPCATP